MAEEDGDQVEIIERHTFKKRNYDRLRLTQTIENSIEEIWELNSWVLAKNFGFQSRQTSYTDGTHNLWAKIMQPPSR